VYREPIPGSRGSFAVLTDAGYAKVAEAAPAHIETVRKLVFDGLDDDQVRTLGEIGAVLVAQLDKGLAAGIGRA
jgi:DNA-binding MarR family transcriptional regulator